MSHTWQKVWLLLFVSQIEVPYGQKYWQGIYFGELAIFILIHAVQVPSNCTDKLQPIDMSLNKSLKNALWHSFQTWHAEEVHKQLSSGVAIDQVKVDMPSSLVNNKYANWLISAWSELTKRLELVVNGFRKVGIFEVVKNVRWFS